MITSERIECEVCIKVINDIKGLSSDDVQIKPSEIRESFIVERIKAYCSQQDHLDTSERKMCYYLEPLLQTTSRSITMKMSTSRVCKKLNRENPDICLLSSVMQQKEAQRTISLADWSDEEITDEYLGSVPLYFKRLTNKQRRDMFYNFRQGVIFA